MTKIINPVTLCYVDEITGLPKPVHGIGNALNVHDSDIHTYPVNEMFHYHTGVSSTFAVASEGTGLENSIELVDSSSFNVGDEIQIGDGLTEISFPKILTNSLNVITLDRYIDAAHPIGETVEVVSPALNYNGSVTPRIYFVKPPPGKVWHITRMLLTMVHTTAGDLGLFGNLSPLTNGVIVRAKIGGAYATFTNWKTNSDIKLDMYDIDFDTRSGGGGLYGTTGRGSFSSISVAVKLDGDDADELQIIIADNLSTLTTFNIKAQGHIESQVA